MLHQDEVTTHPEVLKKLYEEVSPSLDRVIEKTKPLEEKDTLREKIGARKIEENKSKELTVVIDGGYNPIRLGTTEVVPSMAVGCYFEGHNEVKKPKALAKIVETELSGMPARKNRAIINDTLILKLATQIVEPEPKPEQIIVDGLFPPFSGIPQERPIRDPEPVHQNFKEIFLPVQRNFLEKVKKQRVKIAGFVKRPRWTGYQRHILKRKPRGSDSSFLSRYLQIGEMTETYSLSYRGYLRKWLPEYKFFGFHVKCSAKGANRIEIPGWCKSSVGDFAGYFLAYRTRSGWPYQINKTDYYTKVSQRTKDLIYSRWVAQLGRKVKEGELSLEEVSSLTLSPGEFFSLELGGKIEA